MSAPRYHLAPCWTPLSFPSPGDTRAKQHSVPGVRNSYTAGVQAVQRLLMGLMLLHIQPRGSYLMPVSPSADAPPPLPAAPSAAHQCLLFVTTAQSAGQTRNKTNGV